MDTCTAIKSQYCAKMTDNRHIIEVVLVKEGLFMSFDGKEDRRVRRTKKVLREALAELLMEKNIQNITVRELTDKADVNRSTFYANFKDIFDLYSQVEDVVIQEINEILSTEHNLDAKIFFNTLLRYIFDNKQISRLVLTDGANGVFIRRISILFKDLCVECWIKEYNLKCSENELEPYAQFFLSGSIGVIREWVSSNYEYPLDNVMALLSDIDYGFGNHIKDKFI